MHQKNFSIVMFSDHLKAKERLYAGHKLTSLNGRYTLAVQYDGNVVIYATESNKPVWSTKTAGRALGEHIYLCMQSDQNIVLYVEDEPIWASKTRKTNVKNIVLSLQNDGNLVGFGDTKQFWASETSESQPPKQKSAERLTKNITESNPFANISASLECEYAPQQTLFQLVAENVSQGLHETFAAFDADPDALRQWMSYHNLLAGKEAESFVAKAMEQYEENPDEQSFARTCFQAFVCNPDIGAMSRRDFFRSLLQLCSTTVVSACQTWQQRIRKGEKKTSQETSENVYMFRSALRTFLVDNEILDDPKRVESVIDTVSSPWELGCTSMEDVWCLRPRDLDACRLNVTQHRKLSTAIGKMRDAQNAKRNQLVRPCSPK